MRKVNIGSEKYTQVFAVDEKNDANHANHEYEVATADDNHTKRIRND